MSDETINRYFKILSGKNGFDYFDEAVEHPDIIMGLSEDVVPQFKSADDDAPPNDLRSRKAALGIVNWLKAHQRAIWEEKVQRKLPSFVHYQDMANAIQLIGDSVPFNEDIEISGEEILEMQDRMAEEREKLNKSSEMPKKEKADVENMIERGFTHDPVQWEDARRAVFIDKILNAGLQYIQPRLPQIMIDLYEHDKKNENRTDNKITIPIFEKAPGTSKNSR